jgi:hypothetical protein
VQILAVKLTSFCAVFFETGSLVGFVILELPWYFFQHARKLAQNLLDSDSDLRPPNFPLKLIYHQTSCISTMPQAPQRRALTGCRRCKPKHQVTPNERWLHLGARQAGQIRRIQTVMVTTSLFCKSLNQLRALILAAGTVVTAQQADLAVLDAAFDSVSVILVAFLGLLRQLGKRPS